MTQFYFIVSLFPKKTKHFHGTDLNGYININHDFHDIIN